MHQASPSSTGLVRAVFEAAQLNGPLDDQDVPVLYTHSYCPYAQRAWLALLAARVQHVVAQVDLSNKPAWYRTLHPEGLVPCVAWKGHVQVESVDICWCAMTGRDISMHL
jgi:Glutathione S-transferase, N-terminal domain